MYSGTFSGPPPIFIAFFILIAAIILGAIIFAIVKSITQWSYNNAQPVITVNAVVKAKRTRVSGGGETSSHTCYYITFEYESKDRSEFEVKDNEFGLIAEGDIGKLTFQGTRFLGFDRNKQEQVCQPKRYI